MRSQNPFDPDSKTELGRFAGILFNTYILFDQEENLALIDQHAADERIRYERLKNSAFHQAHSELHSQALLIPEAIRFSPERRVELEIKLPLISALGFEIEVFGEDTILFRAVPLAWGTSSLKTRLKNLVDRVLEIEIKTTQDLLLDESLFERLASEACHSAIRAGDHLEEPEAKALVRDLFDCQHPWNCPHGRPTLVQVPKARFEEWFQRKV